MLKFFADSSARRSDYSYCHSSQRRKAKEANLARILQCFKMKTKTFDRISSKYQNKVIFFFKNISKSLNMQCSDITDLLTSNN